jgi:NTE family protein
MTPKRINLALQGGGAHGAFTWGVLDRLLEDDRIEIAAISGTSAGALNGAAVKCGLADGSRQAARDRLEALWASVGAVTEPSFAPWLNAMSPTAISRAIETSWPFAMANAVARTVSPYAYAGLTTNPLMGIVETFDFDRVCGGDGPEFHICATNVRSGKIRIFTGTEISRDVILASACLPTMFEAVEIDGEAYWDGGYTGNPALFPLYARDLPADILVININPLFRAEVPRTAHEIHNRINEISFNSSLLRELRAIGFVQRLLHNGALAPDAMKDVLVHMIADDALMAQLSVATKLIPNAAVLSQLRAAGYAATDRFLSAHFDSIGTRSTVDLIAMFG